MNLTFTQVQDESFKLMLDSDGRIYPDLDSPINPNDQIFRYIIPTDVTAVPKTSTSSSPINLTGSPEEVLAAKQFLAAAINDQYTMDTTLANQLADQIISEDSYVTQSDGYTFLWSKDDHKLIEISPLGTKRFFRFINRENLWILTLDPFETDSHPYGTKTEELLWSADGVLQKLKMRHHNGRMMETRPNKRHSHRTNFVYEDDEIGIALHMVNNFHKSFTNAETIPVGFPNHEIGQGVGVIGLGAFMLHAKGKGQNLFIGVVIPIVSSITH